MRILASSVLTALVAVLSLEAQSGSTTLTRPSLPSPEKLHQMGLRQRWHGHVPMAGTRDRIVQAQAFDQQILVQTASGGVAALDAETGALDWQIRLGDYRSQRLPAAANSHTFCVMAGMDLYGIDRRTGLTTWTMGLQGPLAAAVGVDETRAFLTTVNGDVASYVLPLTRSAFEARSVRDTQTQGTFASTDPVSNPTSLRTPYRLWHFVTDAPVVLPPVVLPTHAVFANKIGVVYAFERDTNKLVDRYYTPPTITAPIAQSGNDLYAASQNYNVYNFEFNGARLVPRWQTTVHSQILAKPVVAGPDLYVVGLDQGLFSLNRMDGAVQWRQPQVEQYLAASKRLIFAADRWGNVLCLDRQKGTVLNTWDTRNWALRIPNEYNDRLYVLNHDGQVLCLHDHDKEYDKPFKHNAPPPVKAPAKPKEDMEEKPAEDK